MKIAMKDLKKIVGEWDDGDIENINVTITDSLFEKDEYTVNVWEDTDDKHILLCEIDIKKVAYKTDIPWEPKLGEFK